jgi:hypothetical protein
MTPDKLKEIEAEAAERYPAKFDREYKHYTQRDTYISCAKEYEQRLEEKEIEIAELKSALQAEEFSRQLSTPPASDDWVKVEDGLPEIPPPYYEDGLKIKPLSINIIVWDGMDVFEESYYEEVDLSELRITHWRYLPTPPQP